MSSRHRRKIARQNGAKAAGTKTPEGIAISSQNARRHGLTSKTLVLATESQDDYLALEQEYINRFQPVGGVEMDLVDDMVSARWRLRRIWGMQTAAIDLKMAIQQADVTQQFIEIDESTRAVVAFSALANEEKSLQLLLRYETTCNRMFNRALKTLRELQKDRQTQTESTVSEKLRNDPKSPDQEPETPVPIAAKNEPETHDCSFIEVRRITQPVPAEEIGGPPLPIPKN